MAEILPFFAVPFGFAKLDDCGPLNQELRALFLARSAEGGEHANPRPAHAAQRPSLRKQFRTVPLHRAADPAAQGILLAPSDPVHLRA
jgi:hypothetical protein